MFRSNPVQNNLHKRPTTKGMIVKLKKFAPVTTVPNIINNEFRLSKLTITIF